MNRIPIDLAELKRLRAIGFTLKQCAIRFNCSISTIMRRASEKSAESNRRCQLRHYYNGPLPTDVERVCKCCKRFYRGKGTSVWCGDDCRKQLANYGYMKLSKRQLLGYTARVGLSRDSLQRIGLTEAEYLEAIK